MEAGPAPPNSSVPPPADIAEQRLITKRGIIAPRAQTEESRCALSRVAVGVAAVGRWRDRFAYWCAAKGEHRQHSQGRGDSLRSHGLNDVDLNSWLHCLCSSLPASFRTTCGAVPLASNCALAR